MRKLLMAFILFFTVLICQAQGGKWMIKMNNKALVATGTENTAANTKKIRHSDWKKNNYLEIIFTEAEPDAWKRSFLFSDESDEQLMTADSVTKVKIPLARLRNVFAGKKELTIYTIASPADPSVAVRMRRVHLCTLKLP